MIFFALSGAAWVILILLVVAFAAVFIIISNKKKKEQEEAELNPPPNLADADIRQAKVQDIVSISGYGDEFDDVDFVIEKKNRYESDGWEWYELLGVYQGRQVWIEWEEDDALEITATSPDRKIRLSSLNVEEDDLARMDEEESTDNFVILEGEKFYYSDSCEVYYYKDCAGSGEGFYLWDFESEDGASRLSIEKWEDEPFKAYTGKRIQPFNVKVYPR